MNTLRIFILSVFILGFTQNEHAQNIVLNGSFEDTISCPPTTGYIYYSRHWFQPNKIGGNIYNSSSTEYFHTCNSTSWVSVPVNYFGTQAPSTGNSYAGFGLYVAPYIWREYAEGTLKKTLVAGKTYCVEFYVSLADTSGYAISNIGIHFSRDSVLDYTFFTPLSCCMPQVQNTSGNYITDKTNWVLISGQFTAQGGERFITIGNFNDDANTQKIFLGGADFAYYYIDDVSVICCDSSGMCELPVTEHSFSLFPNPNNGEFTINYAVKDSSNASFTLYNMLGQKVYEQNLQSGVSTTEQLILPNLANGAYAWRFIVDDIIIKRDKFLIIK